MPKSVLVADDSLTIRKVIGMIFATEDFHLTTVDNGLDAINKTRELRPDVVLADVMMPGKSGYEVCEALKGNPSTQGIPVVLLAGTFEAFDENRARAAGADAHITKPFESQALLDKVKTLVGVPLGARNVPTYTTVGAAGAALGASPPPPTGQRPALGAAPLPPTGQRMALGASPPPPTGQRPMMQAPMGQPMARPPGPGMPGPGMPRPMGQPMQGQPGMQPMARPPGPGMQPMARPGMPGPGMPPPGMQRPGMPGPGMQPMARPGMPGPGQGMQPMQRPGMPGPGQGMQPMARPGMPGPGPGPGGYRPPGPGQMPMNQVPNAPRARDPFGLGAPAHQQPPRPRQPMGEPSVVIDDAMPEQRHAEEISLDVGGPRRAPARGDGGEAHLREALSQASREVVEKIAWEVVPQLAETIIREELERLIKEREGKS